MQSQNDNTNDADIEDDGSDSAAKIKENLCKLGELGIDDPTLQKFGKLMGARMNGSVVPMGFVVCAELMVSDLQRGIDGFSGLPINGSLVGLPPFAYIMIRMEFGHLADVCCEPEFAAEVKKFLAQVAADVAAKRG